MENQPDVYRSMSTPSTTLDSKIRSFLFVTFISPVILSVTRYELDCPYNTKRCLLARNNYPEQMTKFDAKQFVDTLVLKHKVVVLSKTYCPYCSKAVDTLKKYGLKDLHVEQLDANPNMDDIQDYVQTLTGARSVPRIFLAGKFYGDCSSTVKKHEEGTLKEDLANAGAL